MFGEMRHHSHQQRDSPRPARRHRRHKSSPVRTDPELWEEIKAAVQADSRGGPNGKWSARKAQIAVRSYKEYGGGYVGDKDPNSSLSRWTRSNWGYLDPSDINKPRVLRGRYLPSAVRFAMSPKQKRKSNERKREASRRGEAHAPYSKKVKGLMHALDTLEL